MAGELLKAMAGVDIVHVPYKGSSGARTDVIGGQVQMMFDAITTMAPQVRAGKLRALGTSGKVRSTVLADVPTLSEAGVPGYDAVIWLGIMAPAGTPRAIVERLNNEITRAANAPEMKEGWAKQGAVAMSMTPDEFGRYMREDIEKWARIVRISGAKPDQ
jgi:tripartite-type tricarboxylate transporter receptor subunit TctC